MYEELKEGLYENSFCTKEDYLLEEAYNDNVDAMYMLGVLYYHDGRMSDAYERFCEAAAEGQADATYYLGHFYWHPTGHQIVQPSNEKAVEYYLKAVELGSAKAMCELGWQYRQGTAAVEKNTEKAIGLLEKAAELGEPRAFIELAHCYEYGMGVEKDLEKALKYAKQAYDALIEETL